MSSRNVTIWVLVVVFVATGTVFAGIDNGLVVYYEFEGNANDSSGNNYNGTEIGGLSYVEGVMGYAAHFDGIDDYIDMGTKLGGYSAFSVFAWVKAVTLNSGNNFIESSNWYVNDSLGDNGGFQLSITNGYIKSWVNQPNRTASSEISGPYINLNQWYLIGFTWDGSIHRMYLNGVNVSSAPYAGYIGTSAKNSLVGSKYYGSGLVGFFNGNIDDLRIYNRALTQEEITQLYNIGTVAPPVADAGFDQTVTDTDGNGSEQVTLDGSGSTDSDGTIQSYVWSEGGTQIATGVNPNITLSIGQHTITLTVTDDDGLTDTDTVAVTVEPYPNQPPVANADGPYTIYVGDTLTLDASGSIDDDNNIVSYLWDLDDNNSFETDAGDQPVFDVNFAYLQSIGLLVGNTYNIHLKVTDSEGLSDVNDSTLTIIPIPALLVFVDIKPGSCPNPLNVKSSGVLPAAILGTADFDITTIDPTSIRLAGVSPLRSSIEDAAGPAIDSNDCNCTEDGPDGLADLTLKFKTRDIVEAIGDVNYGDTLSLKLTGVLIGERPIEGADCIVISGKHKPFNKFDVNKDGVVDAQDFAIFAQNWLQSSIVED